MRDLRGIHLHFDGSAGAAGDMTLGAFIDLGVPESVVRDAMEAVGIDSGRLTVVRGMRGGLAGIDVKVRSDLHEDEHAHEHAHEHHHYAAIRTRIETSSLADGAKSLALAIFDKLAVAEAAIHGMSVADVAFHEVGAIDSIVDIVGVSACVAYIEPSGVTCAPIATGRGHVHTAHGLLPVPAPATLALLTEAGAKTVDGGIDFELCTPTAAAIFACIVTGWEGAPAMTPRAVGYGLGDRDLPDRPNSLRITGGTLVGSSAAMVVLETNIDDMTPELLAYASERIAESGAIDVWWAPCVMKKGRPGVLLSILTDVRCVASIREVVFQETTTLGIREHVVARSECERTFESVETPYGEIPVKIAWRHGEVVNTAPEYEVCRTLARTHEVPAKEVYVAAIAAYRTRGMVEQ